MNFGGALAKPLRTIARFQQSPISPVWLATSKGGALSLGLFHEQVIASLTFFRRSVRDPGERPKHVFLPEATYVDPESGSNRDPASCVFLGGKI